MDIKIREHIINNFKEDTIEVEGKVLEVLPGGKFKVQLENGIIGYIFSTYVRV